MKSIIVDTGFWVALNNIKDKHHLKATQCLNKFSNTRFITTWPVITETAFLLVKFLGTNAFVKYLELYKQHAFDVFELDETHAEQLIDLIKKYRDLPMDLADVSLVVLAEELGHGNIFSTDLRDPFNNLLLTE